MNWKVIAAMAIPSGALVGGLQALGLLGGWLGLLIWVALAILWRKVILVQSPHKPFLTGFLIAFLAGIISGNVVALNMDVFFDTHTLLNQTGEPVNPDEVPMSFFVLQGGFNGLLMGLLAGGIAGWKTAGQRQSMIDDSEE